VHNAEEALAFRAYLPRLRALLPKPLTHLGAPLSYPAVLGVLTLLSAAAVLLTFAAVARPASRRILWALLVLEAAVGVNVVAHVISAVAVFHGYGPGLATAVTINAPFALYCFRRVRREQWLSPAALLATVPASLVLHGPILLGGLWLAGRVSR
jgi:uncharacterized protein with HXXEE motif